MPTPDAPQPDPTLAPPPRTPDGKLDLSGRPCPACGEARSTVQWRTAWPEHGYPGAFVLRRCEGCGLLVNSPRLDGPALNDLYGRNYYFFARPAARELRRAVGMVARTVAEVVADPGGFYDGSAAGENLPRRVLDVGCGRGYLPGLLGALGWSASGVEISEGAAADARRLFGLDCFAGTVEQYAASPDFAAARDAHGAFPLVTAVDVVEHVPDPAAFAAALAEVVAPGGLLVVDTPNADSYNVNVKGSAWKGFNPFHVYLFTAANLSLLLERHGFAVERSFSYGNAPADAGEPPSARARDATVAALRRARLLRPAAATFFELKRRLATAPADLAPALSRAAGVARSTPRHAATPDATAPLAEGSRGDNVVVIARRR